MIILVEDDADQRLVLGMALRAAGYSVREARDGREALALQRGRPARCLITDIFMPETDGFELIQVVRNEYPSTRIVVISGGGKRTSHDYLDDIRRLGVHAALRKPVEIESLLTTLSALGAKP